MKTITVVSEIQVYIFTLEEHKKKIYKNYRELQDDLKEEFNILVSERDLMKVYEPIVEEDVLDLQIMYNNIMI